MVLMETEQRSINQMKKAVRYGAISSYKNLAIYFKEMASKGYMISSVSTGEHFFDEVNPKDLDFDITIFNEYNLSIYGNREKYIKDKKKTGWKYVFKNDKMIVFCRNADNDTLSVLENDKQQYEMVKSVWRRNFSPKNIITVLIGLVLFGVRMYDFEFPVTFISNNFMKVFVPLTTFLVFAPVFGKTPYWLYKNKRKVSEGSKLYHRKQSTDKLLDVYMYFVVPAIIILKWLLLIGSGDYKLKSMMFVVFIMPAIVFVLFFNSRYFRSLESKIIRYSIYVAVVVVYFFSIIVLSYFVIGNAYVWN